MPPKGGDEYEGNSERGPSCRASVAFVWSSGFSRVVGRSGCKYGLSERPGERAGPGLRQVRVEDHAHVADEDAAPGRQLEAVDGHLDHPVVGERRETRELVGELRVEVD